MRYRPGVVIGATRICIAVTISMLLAGKVNADQSQALLAQRQGNYTEAARLWLQLANDGNPLAQYNLARLYQNGKGVIADPNLYKYWLGMAAHQGYAEAYDLLNSRAIRPTSKPADINIAQEPQDWLSQQNPGYYTLQLASSTNKSQIEKYYDENDLAGKGGFYRSRRSGEDWYSLVYGAYPTVGDAKSAIGKLPEALKKWSPWVRNIKSIQRIMIR